MARLSFFDLLADPDMSWAERSAINAASERADAAMEVATAQGDAFGHAITTLRTRVMAQDTELKLLRAAIGVLAATLRDNNVVDADLLDARLEAAIVNTKEEVERVANTVTCLRCGRQIERRYTEMTADGVVCDRCHAMA
jgi:hypothetical protein